MLDASTRQAIERAAAETGIDPAYMMAVAERESSFNPNAHASKTIYGMYQMTGPIRRQYGMGDSQDPYLQSKAFGAYTNDLRKDMGKRLGREPSYAETYTGHHFGPGRASSMLKDPDGQTSVSDAFTPYELSLNPHIVRAGTTGALRDSTVGDMARRMAKYGGRDSGSAPPSGGTGGPSEPFSFASYGESVDEGTEPAPAGASTRRQPSAPPAAPQDRRDFTARYNTPLAPADEAKFQDWAAKQSQITGRPPTNDLYDYDMRGFWKNNPDFSYANKTQHLTDQFKKPNHPTFSTGSQYHGQDGNQGGEWIDLGNDKWSFKPGATNMQVHGAQGLQDYFSRAEKGNTLQLPAAPQSSPRPRTGFAAYGEPVEEALPTAKKAGLGYDPNLDEMGSGYDPGNAAAVQKMDQGIVKSPSMPSGADAGMEKNPAKVPKQPLSQVPQNELDDNRPDFYQRQFPA